MAEAKDYLREFNSRYEQPQINNITVGFSGIDPSTRGLGSGSIAELTDDQMALMKELILNYISNIEIKIDSGNVDPTAVEPVEPYIKLRPSDIPHEQLAGLLGGNEDGHYHLTEAEHDRIADYPKYSDLNSRLMHEQLPDLLDGSATGHWHLTEEAVEALRKLIATFVSTETGEVVIPEDDHEKLKSLYGGELAGHYHLTGLELTKLQKLIELTFPNGATDPVIPGGGSGDDSGGGDSGGGSSSGDYDFGGLPSLTPPQWQEMSTPYKNKTGTQQYTLEPTVHTMYFGKSSSAKNTTPQTGLHVVMYYGTNNTRKPYLLFTQGTLTTDYSAWSLIDQLTKTEGSQGLSQYVFQELSDGTNRLYATMPGTTASSNRIQYFKNFNSHIGLSDGTAAKKEQYVACAVNSSNNLIMVSRSGYVVRVSNSGKTVNPKKPYISTGVNVNNGCAAWSPVMKRFCVTGPDGTARSVSQDGDGNKVNSTLNRWEFNNNAPKNLVELTYRSDIEGGAFMARSAGEKVFYVSNDGLNWKKYNNAPIPLSTVTAVAYNPDNGWYCAVGGKGKYAYFSKDLSKWVSTKISESEIEAGSVIWAGGSIKRFVLMPTSGSTYYTFNPADWK